MLVDITLYGYPDLEIFSVTSVILRADKKMPSDYFFAYKTTSQSS